jgi:hypothetical protein
LAIKGPLFVRPAWAASVNDSAYRFGLCLTRVLILLKFARSGDMIEAGCPSTPAGLAGGDLLYSVSKVGSAQQYDPTAAREYASRFAPCILYQGMA